jgi:hypothetical protein
MVGVLTCALFTSSDSYTKETTDLVHTSKLAGIVAVIQIQSLCLGIPCPLHCVFRPTARTSHGTGQGSQYKGKNHSTEEKQVQTYCK